MYAWQKQKRRAAAFVASAGKCVYCRQRVTLETMTLDHLIPKANGGGDGVTNLVTACLTCNRAKGATDPVEFVSKIVAAEKAADLAREQRDLAKRISRNLQCPPGSTRKQMHRFTTKDAPL